MKLLQRCLRHLWLDADDARLALGEAGIERLEARVRTSEQEHTGQICLCVEASLPPSYLWRHVARGESIEDVMRDRAVTLFGKQRVWDTEYNNGVLVYLLLAEHRIEIVADRALARTTNEAHWHTLIERVAQACRGSDLLRVVGEPACGSGSERSAQRPRHRRQTLQPGLEKRLLLLAADLRGRHGSERGLVATMARSPMQVVAQDGLPHAAPEFFPVLPETGRRVAERRQGLAIPVHGQDIGDGALGWCSANAQ